VNVCGAGNPCEYADVLLDEVFVLDRVLSAAEAASVYQFGVLNPSVPTSCDDGNPCTDDSCNPATGCQHANNTAPCSDGQFCNGADMCGGGTCSVHAGDPCPGPDGDGNCAESCDEGSDTCTAPDPNGSTCTDGLFCNGADVCGGGTCSVHAGDPCPGPDGDGNCAESCDEGSDTCTAPDPNGSTCTDGLFCNGADVCGGGTCSVHAGDPCAGPDGDGNCAESCDEGSDTCTAPDPNGSACTDGQFCNGTDTCSGGTCSGHAGDPCPGPDGDGDCSESCNEAADSCTANDPNGSACTDGQFCNGTDTCSGGTCSSHAGDPCPGPDGDGDCSESCSEAADSCTANDPSGSACTDGQFCNGADTCSGGTCSNHAGDPCPGPDGDGNCAESCDEGSDTCTAPDLNGSTCTDGLFCNGADMCGGGTCSVHAGDPCAGPDGDGNCAESCDEGSDTCTAPDPNGSACTDGAFCNGADTCSGGTCSSHAGDPCPGPDGDGNCAESCDEGSDTCTAPDPNGSACTDGQFCNGADTCSGGTCSTHAGDPCPGPDGDGNCAESCDEGADSCTANDPNGSACTDGQFCNGTDQCSGGTCSTHAGDPCAGPDGDGDCAESCNESNDRCTARDPDGSACTDGAFCNGTDTCDGGTCSLHTGDPCASGGECADACDEEADSCLDPAATPCIDDGNPCTVDECDGGGTCGHPVGNAGAICRPAAAGCDVAETCDGSSAACPPDGFSPAGTECRPAVNDCDVAESCSGSAATCPADDVAPDNTPCVDGDACTRDACQGGVCVGTRDVDACLDDFQCYRIGRSRGALPFAPLSGVQLDDGFGSGLFGVTRAKHLCLPADKSGEGIVDQVTHLEAYRIRGGTSVRRTVRVVNQLGSLSLDTVKPDLLLVPTAKSLVGPPAPPDPLNHNVDHFQCYRVRVTRGTPRLARDLQVTVADQFTSPPVAYGVRNPRHLCNPVDKNGEGIKNPTRRLLCYRLHLPAQPRHVQRTSVFLANQFGPETVDTVKEYEFCVPSEEAP
jgi:hypothetical protein